MTLPKAARLRLENLAATENALVIADLEFRDAIRATLALGLAEEATSLTGHSRASLYRLARQPGLDGRSRRAQRRDA